MGNSSLWLFLEGGNPPPPPVSQELVVLIGAMETAWTTDGITFTPGSPVPWTNAPSSLSYNGVGFCAIEFNVDNFIYTTGDGDVWLAGPQFVLGGGDNNGIVSNNVRYCVSNPALTNGNILSGIIAGPLGSQLVQASSLVPMTGLACNPAATPYVFMCAGFDGNVSLAWSGNGVAWSYNETYFSGFDAGLFRANNRFFYGNAGSIGTILDPNQPPVELAHGMNPASPILSVVHDGTYYVASNTAGEVSRCMDPVNGPWTAFTGPDEPNGLTIAALTGKIIGLSLNGTNDVFVSNDGGATWGGIVYSGGLNAICGAR